MRFLKTSSLMVLWLGAAVLLLGLHSLRAVPGDGGGRVASQNGDVNGDGGIDIGDPVYLLSWLFQGGPEPVAVAAGGGCPDPETCPELFDALQGMVDAAVGTFEKNWNFNGCSSIPAHVKRLMSSETGADVAVVVENTGEKRRDCTFDVVFYAWVIDDLGARVLAEHRREAVAPGEETEVLAEEAIALVQIENCRDGGIDPRCKGKAQISAP